MELKQVYSTPDGKTFDTKAEAMDYLRRPKILEALNKLTGDNAELSNWFVDNQEAIETAFETGTIRRVSKTEKNQYTKAMEHVKELFEAGDKKLGFLVEHFDDFLKPEQLRYPTVKRMDDDQKAAATKEALMEVANNEELVDWILGSQDDILAAFDAGKEKRPVNPKAQDALKEYRISKAKEKLAEAEAGGDKEAIAKAKAALDKATGAAS